MLSYTSDNIGKKADKSQCIAIARGSIALAHSLGLSVGAETQEQLALLKSVDCDGFQDAYLSRPLPLSELATFLEHYFYTANQT